VDVLLVTRAILLVVFGLAALRLAAIFFWCVLALLCLRSKGSPRLKRRGCCSAACSVCLDYLSSLSPCGNVLVIFFVIFPPIFYDRVFMPCFECYDFEAAVAHEVGHVLGFGHPDELPQENLVGGACVMGNATCRQPFDCATQAVYTSSERSIMHSLTRHAPRTCLSLADMHGLHLLYPLCDALQPTTVSCIKGRRTSGWLRLAIVVGVPFLLAVVVILVPLTCLRWRDRRRMRVLDRELGDAHTEIAEYRAALTQALRSTVRDAISRPATALQHGGRRPGTALSRLTRAANSRNGRVHPAGGRVKLGDDKRQREPTAQPAAAPAPPSVAAAAEKRLTLEDVAEEHSHAASASRPSQALNGYTGVAWPAAANRSNPPAPRLPQVRP